MFQDPQPQSHFVITAYELQGKAPRWHIGADGAGSDETIRFPSGWDEERVRRVLEHYESQSDEEAVAEDEAALSASTVMDVPRGLGSDRSTNSFAKHKKSA